MADRPRAFTVIVNPAAGDGRARRLADGLPARLAAAGLEAEVVVSPDPDAPAALAGDSLSRGRVVVACGGDGLVGVLAAAAAEHGGTLGILPCGSGNDFARALGLDARDLDGAVGVLGTGAVRQVDLGTIDGRSFCTVAGVGFLSAANAWANRHPRLPGTVRYVAAVLRTLLTFRPRRYGLTVDGAIAEVDAWLVALANAPWLGGGMRIAPDATLDDGLLDVVVVGALPRLAFLRTFPKVFEGSHVDHPAVTVLRGAVVRIEGGAGAEPVFADGEPQGALPLTAGTRSAALSVLAPAPDSGRPDRPR